MGTLFTNQLGVAAPLSGTVQYVGDENQISSAVAISQQSLQVSLPGTAPVGGPYVLAVLPAETTGPTAGVLVQSASTEASIRFVASGKGAFHVGVGGAAGDGTFFCWSDTASGNGITLQIAPNGNVTIAQNLTVNGSFSVGSLLLPNMPFAGQYSGPPLKHVMIDPSTGNLYYQ